MEPAALKFSVSTMYAEDKPELSQAFFSFGSFLMGWGLVGFLRVSFANCIVSKSVGSCTRIFY